MSPAESIPAPIVSNIVMPIDLKPPKDWLDNFPLSRTEFKELHTSFERALQLPTTLEAFQKDLSFDRSAMEMFRGDLDPLIKFYAKLFTYAKDYKDNVLPSFNSLPRDLMSYAGSVQSYYPVVYSALKDFSDKDGGHEWSMMLINHVTQKVTSNMDQFSHTAQVVIDKLSKLKVEIDVDMLGVPENLDRLRKKLASRKGTVYAGKRSSQNRSKYKDEASALEVILLQFDILGDALCEILKNTTATILIVNSMRDQFVSIRDDFNTLVDKTQDVGSIPANLLAPDSPKIVYGQWRELEEILGDYIRSICLARDGFGDDEDSSWK
jgi:hypothetical protein